MIKDPVSETRLSQVHPWIGNRWREIRDEFWEINELQLRIVQGFRTFAEQWALYALGRKKNHAGIWIVVDRAKVVTHARGGESFHNFGLALDCVFMGDDPYLDHMSQDDSQFLWSEYGRLCDKHGLEWGGTWKVPDRPHCEKKFGLSLHELQLLYEEQGLQAVFAKCSAVLACGKEITKGEL
jgi:hypothetical protein